LTDPRGLQQLPAARGVVFGVAVSVGGVEQLSVKGDEVAVVDDLRDLRPGVLAGGREQIGDGKQSGRGHGCPSFVWGDQEVRSQRFG
jgi:hypothetical protein